MRQEEEQSSLTVILYLIWSFVRSVRSAHALARMSLFSPSSCKSEDRTATSPSVHILLLGATRLPGSASWARNSVLWAACLCSQPSRRLTDLVAVRAGNAACGDPLGYISTFGRMTLHVMPPLVRDPTRGAHEGDLRDAVLSPQVLATGYGCSHVSVTQAAV